MTILIPSYRLFFKGSLYAVLGSLLLLRCDFFDITPPKITIIKPKKNITYFDTLPIEIDVTDDSKIAKVEVFLKGEYIYEFSRGPYETDFDFGLDMANLVTLRAIAYDKAGNHAEASRQAHIGIEIVSIPNAPDGPSAVFISTSYSYSTGGANSNAGHSLQYRFDWGGGYYSTWSTSTSASHSWSSVGTRNLRAQARCASHTGVVSGWSNSKTVAISASGPSDLPPRIAKAVDSQ